MFNRVTTCGQICEFFSGGRGPNIQRENAALPKDIPGGDHGIPVPRECQGIHVAHPDVAEDSF
jgi:hypothetical protein